MSTKFKKGQSGNPKGRTTGSGVSGQIRKAITDKVPELLQVVIDKALNEGDTQAAMLLLNKVVPNLKASSEPIQFKLNAKSGLAETGETIVQSIASGAVALDSGTALLSGLASLAKLQEVDDLVKRITALENKS